MRELDEIVYHYLDLDLGKMVSEKEFNSSKQRGDFFRAMPVWTTNQVLYVKKREMFSVHEALEKLKELHP